MYRDVKKWMALNAFTAVLKIFKYLKLSSRMNSLWEVLERALSDMLAFMLILFFIMAGFGVFGVVRGRCAGARRSATTANRGRSARRCCRRWN